MGGQSRGKRRGEKRWGWGRYTVGHLPAVVIYGRSEGSGEPLATTLIREGQNLEGATDRKLLQHSTILIRIWNAWAVDLKHACRILIVYGSFNFGLGSYSWVNPNIWWVCTVLFCWGPRSKTKCVRLKTSLLHEKIDFFFISKRNYNHIQLSLTNSILNMDRRWFSSSEPIN